MGWMEEQIKDALRDIIRAVATALQGFIESLIEAVLGPIVGVPAPTSDARYIVVGAPDNQPWHDLYLNVYLTYVLPLTFVFLFVGLAYIGVRAGSMSAYRRTRLLRRIALVFMGAFVWFPLVSIPLQFINAIGMAVAPISEMSSSFGGAAKGFFGVLIIILIVKLIENIILLATALVFALRYVGIIVLTILMPLLGALWALDMWPLSSVSNIVRRAAAVYPGLVLAGLPAAFLFRFGWEADFFRPDTLFDVLIALMMLPGACVAAILTVYWSAPTLQRMARTGAKTAATGAPATAAAAKSSTGKAVRGARNVHRGLADSPRGALTKSGQATFGSGGSTAYKAGDAARKVGIHAERYNNLRKASAGRMRDKTKEDLSRAEKLARQRSKAAFKRTKEKVSRW